MSTQTLWLVRHGIRQDMVDPSWIEGQERPYDMPLAEQGLQQANEVGRRLAEEPIDHIFSSPFRRAMETSANIVGETGRRVKIEKGLSELLYEAWFPTDPDLDGQVDVARSYPHGDDSYESYVEPEYPEDDESLAARASRVAEDVIDRHIGNLLIVAHGGSITAICRALLGPETRVHTCCCCLIEISRNGSGWELVRDGTDTSHLSITEDSLH